MDDQKKKAISELIKAVNELDLASVMLLANGANMLRTKEKLDLAALAESGKSDLRDGCHNTL